MELFVALGRKTVHWMSIHVVTLTPIYVVVSQSKIKKYDITNNFLVKTYLMGLS
jgi:hypothetical protein